MFIDNASIVRAMLTMAKSVIYDVNLCKVLLTLLNGHLIIILQYSKGDYNEAIVQYTKTIGKVGPSYVIMKVPHAYLLDCL